MDKFLTRTAILIAIVFMISVIWGVWYMLFGDWVDEEETRIFCPRCGHEFVVEIP